MKPKHIFLYTSELDLTLDLDSELRSKLARYAINLNSNQIIFQKLIEGYKLIEFQITFVQSVVGESWACWDKFQILFFTFFVLIIF